MSLSYEELRQMRAESRDDPACIGEFWWVIYARKIERAATIEAMRRCAEIVTAEMIGFADDDAQLLRARSEIRAEITKLEA